MVVSLREVFFFSVLLKGCGVQMAGGERGGEIRGSLTLEPDNFIVRL